MQGASNDGRAGGAGEVTCHSLVGGLNPKGLVPMAIARIEVHRVQVPMKPDAVTRVEQDTDGTASFTQGLDKHILKVKTDGGLVGLGETWKGTPDAAVRAAAESLLGLDPVQLSLSRLPLPHDPEVVNVRDLGAVVPVPVRSVQHNPAVHAFEVAIADIVGQAVGVPVCQLLGGAVRDRVLVHYWAGRRAPQDLARIAVPQRIRASAESRSSALWRIRTWSACRRYTTPAARSSASPWIQTCGSAV